MRLGRFAQVVGGALAALLALWLGLVWWGGRTGIKAYQAAEYETAEDRYSLAGSFMPAERWKALFGAGTAVLAGGEAARAEGLLEQALAEVPEAKQCLVRVNLSLAQERQGDGAEASSGRTAAVEFWETALKTLRDGQCPAWSDPAAEAEERLELKLDSPDEQPEDESEGGGEGDQEGQDGAGEADAGGEPSTIPGDAGGATPSPRQSGGGSGSADPGGGAASPGQPSQGGAGAMPGPTDDDGDLADRLERLQDQNRRGQIERQDQVDPYPLDRSWDRPVW